MRPSHDRPRAVISGCNGGLEACSRLGSAKHGGEARAIELAGRQHDSGIECRADRGVSGLSRRRKAMRKRIGIDDLDARVR